MSKSINPGLLYHRFYFDARYDEVLDIDAWTRKVKNKSKSSKPMKFGFKSNYLTGVPKEDKTGLEKSKAHFSLRNDVLHNFIPSACELGINEGLKAADSVQINLKTTYPGLLIGLGYNHQISAEAAINAGFSFDHTTGLPVIPGSSVKGALRAVFPASDLDKAKTADNEEDRNKYEAIAEGKLKWLTKASGLDTKQISLLEKELFDCHIPNPDANQAKKEPFRPLPGPCRPIFHDAVLRDAPFGQKKSQPIFGPDNITPHHKPGNASDKSVPDHYKEPNPISLLKVMPGVTFAFSFRLPERYLVDGFPAKPVLSPLKTEALFRKILETYGIGAKSRVGYGRLVADPTEKQSVSLRDMKTPGVFLDENFLEMDEGAKVLGQEDLVEVTVTDVRNGKVFVEFRSGHTRFYDLSRAEYQAFRNAVRGDRFSAAVKSRFSTSSKFNDPKGDVEYITTPISKIN